MWWAAAALADEVVQPGAPPPTDAREVVRVISSGIFRTLVLRRSVTWGGVTAEETIDATPEGIVSDVEWWLAFPTADRRAAFLAALTTAAGATRCEPDPAEGIEVFVVEGALAYVADDLPAGLRVRAHAWRGGCETLVSELARLDRPWTPATSPFRHRVDANGPPPVFSGPAAVSRRAVALWDAGTACTGRQPAHWTEIDIVADPSIEAAGLARDRVGALREIRVARVDDLDTLAHEVAHAWDGTPADPVLREGLAELLSDCMLGVVRGASPVYVFATDPTGADARMTWEEYRRATELVRRASSILPASTLWSEGPKTWGWFWTALIDSGAPRAQLDAVAMAYPRHDALDADLDGLSVADERDRGTDPWRWDSDADGWWDGAEPAGDAVALPARGAFVCVGTVGRRDRRRLELVVGGEGEGVGAVVWRIGEVGPALDRLPAELDAGVAVFAAFEPEPGVPARAWVGTGPLGPCGEAHPRHRTTARARR